MNIGPPNPELPENPVGISRRLRGSDAPPNGVGFGDGKTLDLPKAGAKSPAFSALIENK